MPPSIRLLLLIGPISFCAGQNVYAGELNVVPITERILSISVQTQHVEKGVRGPFKLDIDEGREINPGPRIMPAWTAEGMRLVPKEWRWQLPTEGDPLNLGVVYHPFPDFTPHLWSERIVGEPLDVEMWSCVSSYTLCMIDENQEKKIWVPLKISRKTIVVDDNDISGEKVLRHVFFLEFGYAMEQGQRYNLTAPPLATVHKSDSLGTVQKSDSDGFVFVYDPRNTRNPAIRTNQIGYRAGDPFKRAFITLWMGTGGGLELSGLNRFEIIEVESGATVYRGTIDSGFPAYRAEGFSTEANFVGANVYYLDFHDFTTAGEFKIYVPGLGVSYPIRIGEDTWAVAFRTAMHGFLSHRSGIELGPPFSRYVRPRNMHPEDGFRVFAIPYTMLEGESEIVAQAIREKMASGVDPDEWEIVPNAWGGYMDAGDWDRRSQHLSASRDLAELYAQHYDFFRDFALNLPEAEATDSIPDLLNEVIWNVGFYRRLQMPDGGVRGGIESTEHPRRGEASWEESLVIAAFAPDPMTSYSYAAAAAQLAKVLRPYDKADADAFAESALRAWAWAEANAKRVLAEAAARTTALPGGVRPRFRMEQAEALVKRMRFVAAGELFALTGDIVFNEIYRSMILDAGDDHDEMGSYFRYAMLPESQTCPETRSIARQRLLDAAERAIEFGRSNAFGLHTQSPGLPVMSYVGFYSVPEMVTGPVLPRAYMLTGERRFLSAALKAAHFSAGANPMSRTFTTGVGYDYPRNPLHIDSRVTGQPAPDGITIYGPMDAGANFSFTDWTHRYHLTGMVPDSRTWPAAAWHVDLFRWPAMSEYTIHQTFRPVAYYWGFLAANWLTKANVDSH